MRRVHGGRNSHLATVRRTTSAEARSYCETELGQLLQQRGIDHLAIGGLHSDCCIDITVRHALALGYHVSLAGDAYSTVDNAVLPAEKITAHHYWVLARLQAFGTRMDVVRAVALRFA